MNSISLKIGTRGSPLALAQAGEVRALLARAHGCDLERFEIVVIRTSGDMIQDRALAEAGGKGLFTREIDAAMLMGEIDVAVHSAKDLPTVLPEGIVVAGYLPREDVRDALISARADTIAGLPRGGTLGTASLRRQAQVKRLRPDLEVGLLRGNVETRLGKAERGEIDATLLAYAGLKRLGLARRATALLDIETFLPAVGQGAIALTTRAGDASASGALAPILDAATGWALAAERAFLGALDGSCRTPIAGHARVDGGMLDFRGMVLRANGSETFEVHARGDVKRGREAWSVGRPGPVEPTARGGVAVDRESARRHIVHGWTPAFAGGKAPWISDFLTKIKKCTSFRCRFTRDGGRICCEMTGQSACMAPFSLMWLQEPFVIAIGRSFDRAFLQAAASLCAGFASFGLIWPTNV